MIRSLLSLRNVRSPLRPTKKHGCRLLGVSGWLTGKRYENRLHRGRKVAMRGPFVLESLNRLVDFQLLPHRPAGQLPDGRRFLHVVGFHRDCRAVPRGRKARASRSMAFPYIAHSGTTTWGARLPLWDRLTTETAAEGRGGLGHLKSGPRREMRETEGGSSGLGLVAGPDPTQCWCSKAFQKLFESSVMWNFVGQFSPGGTLARSVTQSRIPRFPSAMKKSASVPAGRYQCTATCISRSTPLSCVEFVTILLRLSSNVTASDRDALRG
jgi:hypothetical protein